jgi:hypothetical protein
MRSAKCVFAAAVAMVVVVSAASTAGANESLIKYR